MAHCRAGRLGDGRARTGIDWSATALGPIEDWPRSLKTVVGVVLGSPFQMAIYWGQELRCIYNDAERRVLSELHPGALGRPARELLADAWPTVGPQLQAVMERGETTYAENAPLTFNRRGEPEIGYFTYSYSPIPDDAGHVGGVLLVTEETTWRVLAERRMAVLRRLPECGLQARSVRQAGELTVTALRGADVPLALLYEVDEREPRARRIAVAAPSAWSRALPAELDLGDGGGQVAAAQRSSSGTSAGGTLIDIERLLAPGADAPPGVTRAYVSVVRSRSSGPGTAILITGISGQLRFDDAYRNFVEMAGLGLERNLAAARGREQERARARAMASLNRAKTALFSNTSHELRTPLALILGHLERIQEEELSLDARDSLRIAERSAMRMLKLVGALLDLSRIEAGEPVGAFGPTALPELTRELAAMFRSTAQRAGLELEVDCPSLPSPVIANAEAWEQIVGNLISNALKFTPSGRISVRTRAEGGEFVLTVQDTGIGIAEEELEQIFSRFHRSADPRARTHEGSGVGLALVRELVSLHGGAVQAQSSPGEGTGVVVRVPLRPAQAPQPGANEPPSPLIGRLASLSVAEAEGWVQTAAGPEPLTRARARAGAPGAAEAPSPADQPVRVLVVEDNADMRSYLCRLLGSRFSVQPAGDGTEACRVALEDPPGAVIADVMMPGMDGFSLLRELRRDTRTRDVAVILVSARADPESTAAALELGADDYIIKPFGAREFLARVQSTLENSRQRTDRAQAKGRLAGLRARDGELRTLLNDLRAAQRRVTVAGDLERSRIERDLHDGAQQRLISIRLELGMLRDLVQREPDAVRAKLDELHAATGDALEELHELAQGVYPALLASDGLHAALAALARRMSIPVSIEARGIGRAPRSIENAAYFCCLEALQNAGKHAGPGVRATVELGTRDGVLEFAVRDDGVGFDARTVARSRGLVNLRDRVDALAGRLEITSAPGHGTCVAGQIPLP